MRRTLVFLASLVPVALSAQNPPARAVSSDSTQHRVAVAARRNGEIHLDGKLDELAWQAAQPATGFLQSYPKPNEKAPDQTDVRVLYDDAARAGQWYVARFGHAGLASGAYLCTIECNGLREARKMLLLK